MNTEDLANCLSSLVEIIKQMQMVVMKPIISDLQGNITKIRNSSESNIIQALGQKKPHEGIEWGTYTLQFFTELLFRLVSEEQHPRIAATSAYETVLKQHHNRVLRSVFLTGFTMLPSREDFCARTNLEITDDLVKMFREFKKLSDKFCTRIITALGPDAQNDVNEDVKNISRSIPIESPAV